MRIKPRLVVGYTEWLQNFRIRLKFCKEDGFSFETNQTQFNKNKPLNLV